MFASRLYDSNHECCYMKIKSAKVFKARGSQEMHKKIEHHPFIHAYSFLLSFYRQFEKSSLACNP